MSRLAALIPRLIAPPKLRSRHSSSGTKLRLENLEPRLALSGFDAVDGAYLEQPWTAEYQSIAVRPADQKLIVGGWGQVSRYDSLGNLDPTFGSAGIASAPGGSSGVRLQPDGKILSAGNVYGSGVDAVSVGRLTADGAVDASFGVGGVGTVRVGGQFESGCCVALQSTGKVVVVGSQMFSPAAAIAARFTTTGALDSGSTGFGNKTGSGKNATAIGYTFATNIRTYTSVVVQATDNKVLAAGVYGDSVNDTLVVVRYSADGVLDKTFGFGGSVAMPIGANVPDNHKLSLALQADGKIVVTGSAAGIDGVPDLFVTRLNTNGTKDTTFGGTGSVRLDVDGATSASIERARGVAIQPDGKIVVVGNVNYGTQSNTQHVIVARYNANGTPDTTFAPGGFKLVSPPVGAGAHSFRANDLAVLANGDIIVAGTDWSTAPPVTVVISGTGRSAQATATVDSNGAVTGITVTSGGIGYDENTTVTLVDGRGAGATAVATVSPITIVNGKITGGAITGITVTNPGSGYFEAQPLLMRFYGTTPSPAAPLAPATTDAALLLLMADDPLVTGKRK